MRLPRVLLVLLAVVPACGLLHRQRGSVPVVLDLNTAPRKRVEMLLGITPSIARRIVAGRPYAEPHELVERGILTEREFARIADHVTVARRAP